MKKIKFFQEYLDIISEAQEKRLKNLNCYLMPQDIQFLIQKERLFYLKNENIIEIIEENDNYYKVCFYSNENLKFLSFVSEKPILIDLPYSGEKNQRFYDLENMLLREGFVLNAESSRMIKRDFSHKEIDDKIFQDYSIAHMKETDIEKVMKIWKDNFDDIQNLLYSKEELKEHIDDIYVCKDKLGNIVGVMEIVISGKNGWIQKIAIDKSFQGKGLGTIMEIFYINTCKTLGIKNLLLYTIDDNLQAQAFHKKFGFVPDGKHNCQYIYRR